MIKFFRISGNSLYPLLKNGELVFAIRRQYVFNLKPKDIVTFTHDGVGVMIKQIRYIKNSQVFVEGTSPDSLDSRVFGTIPLEAVTHKILFRLPLLCL